LIKVMNHTRIKALASENLSKELPVDPIVKLF
jgi:hypothetical protein